MSASAHVIHSHFHHDATDRRPSRAEAEEAVRTLLRWAGDDPDPDREGYWARPSGWRARTRSFLPATAPTRRRS